MYNVTSISIEKKLNLIEYQLDDLSFVNDFKTLIDNNISDWSYKTNVKGHFTGFKSLVENKDFINILKNIQENIQVIYKKNFIISDVWGNICRINDEVVEHSHDSVSGFCGIIYLTDGGPGTYFKEYNLLVEEEIGKYVLFHPLLKHSVKKIENNIERITVAFNMKEVKDWDDLTNVQWVNKNEI